MKKLFSLIIIGIILSSIPLVIVANSNPVTCKIVYVYDKNFARPDGVGKPPKPDPEPE